MGKWCLQASSFILIESSSKLLVTRTGTKSQTSSNSSQIGSVTYELHAFEGDLNFQNLSWPFRWKYTGYRVGATPLTVFHWLFWNFSDVFCMEWRCACGLDIILWVCFLSLFLLCELSHFSVWNAIKVYRQWVPCGHNSSYSFPPIVLKHCRCFQHEMKMCMWFGYNTLIMFLISSALWT